jgi:hypothetical protein
MRKLIAVLALAVAAVSVAAMTTSGAGASDKVLAHFNLVPANAKILPCLAKYPNDPSRPPKAEVTVVKGNLNDRLVMRVSNIKPGLQFDLFTVQRTPLLASGAPDPAFPKTFGMAWYQSDVEAGSAGEGTVAVQTVLLDQIFGFDADTGLAPTNTFHLGFWFNNPQDAAQCGFDVTHPTPFNGDHRAGPLAMISLPDAQTRLGPLCINPDASQPSGCNP